MKRPDFGPRHEQEEALLQHLDVFISMMAQRDPQHRGRRSLMGLIRDQGRLWTPANRPRNVERGTRHHCYKNALLLANARDDLTYVEGYVMSFVPIQHAWCVDREGNVVDPTLAWANKRAFYGVPFQTDFVTQTVCKRRVYGLLGNPEVVEQLLDTDPMKWRRVNFLVDTQKSMSVESQV